MGACIHAVIISYRTKENGDMNALWIGKQMTDNYVIYRLANYSGQCIAEIILSAQANGLQVIPILI